MQKETKYEILNEQKSSAMRKSGTARSGKPFSSFFTRLIQRFRKTPENAINSPKEKHQSTHQSTENMNINGAEIKSRMTWRLFIITRKLQALLWKLFSLSTVQKNGISHSPDLLPLLSKSNNVILMLPQGTVHDIKLIYCYKNVFYWFVIRKIKYYRCLQMTFL